jgi:hypothetical protein
VSLRDTLIQLGFVSVAAVVAIAVRAVFVVRRARKPGKSKGKPKQAPDRKR